MPLMFRHASALSLTCLLATALSPQETAPEVTLPDLFSDQFHSFCTVDRMRSWVLSANRPNDEHLVQLACWKGGNAVHLRHFRTRIATNIQTTEELSLPHQGIRSVHVSPESITLNMFSYQAGDSRCCPTGQEHIFLSR